MQKYKHMKVKDGESGALLLLSDLAGVRAGVASSVPSGPCAFRVLLTILRWSKTETFQFIKISTFYL